MSVSQPNRRGSVYESINKEGSAIPAPLHRKSTLVTRHSTNQGIPDASTMKLWVMPVLAELLGTFLFIFAICIATAMSNYLAHSIIFPTMSNGETIPLPMIPGISLFLYGQPVSISTDISTVLASGFLLTGLLVVVGHISGGHLNPMVTLGFLSTGNIEPVKALLYIAAQFCGAMAGAGGAWGCLPDLQLDGPKAGGVDASNSFAFKLGDAVNPWQGFMGEMFGGSLLMMVYMACTLDCRAAGNLAPISIGMTYAALTAALQTTDGAALNPVRAFGVAVAYGSWANHWIYWIGPLVGGVIGAQVYNLLFIQYYEEDKK